MFHVEQIKTRINQFISAGTLDKSVINALLFGEKMVPTECELWDYKLRINTTDALETGKIVKHIAAFHNTYGGYILIGVNEVEKDTEWLPVGFDHHVFKFQELKGKLKSVLSDDLGVKFQSFKIDELKDQPEIGLILISKRGEEPPVQFDKNGPDDGRKGPIYYPSQTYMRERDNSVLVRREKHAFLNSARNYENILDKSPKILRSDIEAHLPNRDLICGEFVGRDYILDKVWEWLSDEFRYVCVLAGEGGKGKTSIALQFAIEVIRTQTDIFDIVLWLSAKKTQFVGIKNKEVFTPEVHYYDYHSLLESICYGMLATEGDIAEVGPKALLRLAKKSLIDWKALIIVDDVDSLQNDEQKAVAELVMQISNRHSRILLTTRNNMSFSPESCIEIPGMEETEYRQYLESLVRRYVPGLEISDKTVREFRASTDGSPLLTESIFSLIRSGSTPSQALKVWKGKAGEDARDASIKKEIQRLSPQALRVMYAASKLVSSSRSELMQVCEYGDVTIDRALQELHGLFLIGSPRFTEDEPRQEVKETTQKVVLSMAEEVLTDFSELNRKLKEVRKGATTSSDRKTSETGAAIYQANAQLFRGDKQSAIATVDAVLKRASHRNDTDLMLMKGRCLISPPADKSQLDEAIGLFRSVSKLGTKKNYLLFPFWEQAESQLMHGIGVVRVCDIALKDNPSDQPAWHYKRARGLVLCAGEINGTEKIERLEQAAESLKHAISGSKGERREEYQRYSEELHDFIWELGGAHGDNPWKVQFDVSRKAIGRGDKRYRLLARLVRALESCITQYANKEFSSRVSAVVENDCEHRLGVLNTVFSSRKRRSNQVEEETIENLLQRFKLLPPNLAAT